MVALKFSYDLLLSALVCERFCDSTCPPSLPRETFSQRLVTCAIVHLDTRALAAATNSEEVSLSVLTMSKFFNCWVRSVLGFRAQGKDAHSETAFLYRHMGRDEKSPFGFLCPAVQSRGRASRKPPYVLSPYSGFLIPSVQSANVLHISRK